MNGNAWWAPNITRYGNASLQMVDGLLSDMKFIAQRCHEIEGTRINATDARHWFSAHHGRIASCGRNIRGLASGQDA